MKPPSDVHAHLLRWRHVETPCPACGGAGGRMYSSGATWRGGMGTTASAWDVCDRCWGSGDADHPWTDLRKLTTEESQRVAAGAAEALAQSCGTSLSVMRPAVLALCEELDRLARGRKPRPPFFDNVCMGLARVLRRAVGEPKSGG